MAGVEVRTHARLRGVSMVAGLTLMATLVMAPAPAERPDFERALRIAGTYHRALSLLPARYSDQPETATYEFERLTAEAMDAQFAVAIEPCFVRWWAYEYMGLELTALSLELRRAGDRHSETADILERLGADKWADAMALLPVSASACGLPGRQAPVLVSR